MDRQDRIVMKFGGKCLANLDLIKEVADFLKKHREKKPEQKIVVVVSAMGNFTDEVLNQLRQLAPETFGQKRMGREIDYASQAGEGISAAFLATRLNEIGILARSLNALQLSITTCGKHQEAMIKDINLERLENEFLAYEILVVTGFQGVHEFAQDEIVTLGRGGSDTTAVAIAARLGCKCEFYKKAAGITAFDPVFSEKVKVLNSMSYTAAKNLSLYGYQFLHPRCLDIAQRFSVPLEFKASPGLGNDPWAKGTIIGESQQSIEETEYDFRAIAVKAGICFITFNGVPNKPGWSEKIFKFFAGYTLLDFQQILTDFERQYAIINLIVDEDTYHSFKSAEENPITNVIDLDPGIKLCGGEGLTCLTYIDPRMVFNPGFGHQISQALAVAGINIEGQYSSGDKIHTFIAGEEKKAVLALAEKFGLLNT